jgi:hypothetical protein
MFSCFVHVQDSISKSPILTVLHLYVYIIPFSDMYSETLLEHSSTEASSVSWGILAWSLASHLKPCTRCTMLLETTSSPSY